MGDRITVGAETRTVVTITSNTALTVDTAFTDTANDTSVDRLAASLRVKDSGSVTDLIVKDDGNVGIGTTIAADGRLDVVSTTSGLSASGLQIVTGQLGAHQGSSTIPLHLVLLLAVSCAFRLRLKIIQE